MTKQENNKKRYSALLKRIAKIAAVVLAVFVLCFGLAFGYLYTHQDKIKQVITNNLNQQLNTKVSVGGIEIDFFSKFPEVSVKFSNVRAEEALSESEQSLFLFKEIFVRFSIWDLLGEDYTVRKLSYGVGVERTFPIHSPSVAKLEVVKRGDVRRAKVNYLRERTGKSAKVRELREDQ